MMFLLRPKRLASLLPVVLVLLGLGLAGCGGDDDDDSNPASPGTAEFDQGIAQAQAQVAAPMAIAMVQNLPLFSQGFGGKAQDDKDYDYTFGWNAETEQWEAHATYDAEGYDFDFLYAVQYRDALGEPQQAAAGAVSMRYLEDGTADYSYSGDGTSVVIHQEYDSNVDVTGLQLETMLMNGSGGYLMEYDIDNDGQQYSADLEARWETLGAGIAITPGSCPVGALRYDFPPFHVIVEFDGTSTVTFTMYDADDTVIPGGSGTETISCSS
jgi:hypothetical protein